MRTHFYVLKWTIILWILGLFVAMGVRHMESKDERELLKVQITLEDAIGLDTALWLNVSRSLKEFDVNREMVDGNDIQTRVYPAIAAKRPVVIFCDFYCQSSYKLAKDLRALTGVDTVYALKDGTAALTQYEVRN